MRTANSADVLNRKFPESRQPELRQYLMRAKDGTTISVVKGLPVTIAALPGWEFYIRPVGDSWVLSEVRSGSRFPSSYKETLEDALAQYQAFCDTRGIRECEAVFQAVIDRYGELQKLS